MTVDAEKIPTGNEISWYLCSEETAENVGTGDGVEVTFDLDNYAAEYTETIYLDGVAKQRETDYIVTYRPPTKTVTQITFTSPPGNGAAITADYAACPDSKDKALLSQDISVTASQNTIEDDIHGRDQKLKKVTGYDLKVKLSQIYADCELIHKFCGDLETDTPVTGKRKYTYGGPNKVYLLLGRLTRKDVLKGLYYLWGVSGLPDLTMGAKDFARLNIGELTVESLEIIEDM